MAKKYLIKEATRERCNIVAYEPAEIRKKFHQVNLETYHLLYRAKKITFSIFFKIENEMIEFIRPIELSKELLEQLWQATLKFGSDLGIYILKEDLDRYQKTIDHIRKVKIAKLIDHDPLLDPKVLEVFADLSSASQMIVKGGITSKVAEKVSAAAAFMVTNLMDSDAAVGTLSRMINIDSTLYDHSASVAMFSGIMALKNLPKNLTQPEAQVVAQCGLYHDAGKTCVPAAILNKPGSFNDEEYNIIKKHTILGYKELLKSIDQGAPIDEIIARVAIEHHERFAGIGYPYGRKGRLEDDPKNGIHLYSRIIAIADAYSALLMKRVYKPALEAREAITLMSKNAEKDFDMEIFNSFVESVSTSMKKFDDEDDEENQGSVIDYRKGRKPKLHSDTGS